VSDENRLMTGSITTRVPLDQ